MGKRSDLMQAGIVGVMQKVDGPMSAYDILGELRSANPKLAPTTVYRALSALSEKGAIHRLESLNAYTLCQHDDDGHDAILSICDDCGSVEETVAPDILKTMSSVIGKSGFVSSRHVVEVHGTCAACDTEQPGQ